MKKRNIFGSKKSKYYDISALDRTNADYRIAFGKRSNGKTFQVLKNIVKEYMKSGRPSVYVRRLDSNFTYDEMNRLTLSLCCDGNGKNQILELSNGIWDSVYYFGRRWYLARKEYDDEGNSKLVKDNQPFMYGQDISTATRDKGSQFPDVKIVFLDEFLSKEGYLKNEFSDFMNLLSTIKRNRNDLVIYMMGNTVTKTCPYFAEMGIKHFWQMKQGTIDIYEFQVADSEVSMKVAVEYTTDTEKTKESDLADRYFCFDNNTAKMITKGTWEIDEFPHLTREYDRQKDVAMSYYILHDEMFFRCDIIIQDDAEFTFIHKWNMSVKPDEMIFSLEPDVRINYNNNLMKPRNGVEQRIKYFFTHCKVFYDCNETGDFISNFRKMMI